MPEKELTDAEKVKMMKEIDEQMRKDIAKAYKKIAQAEKRKAKRV